jgi:hypothetical protein
MPAFVGEPMVAVLGGGGGGGVDEPSPVGVELGAAPVDAAGAKRSPPLSSQAPTTTISTRAATTNAAVERADRPVGSLASAGDGDGVDRGDTVLDAGMVAALGPSRLRSAGWFITDASSTLLGEAPTT